MQSFQKPILFREFARGTLVLAIAVLGVLSWTLTTQQTNAQTVPALQEETKAAALQQPSELSEDRVDPQDVLDVQRLDEDYRPAEGQAVRRIPTPFPASRMAFYRSEYAKQAKLSSAVPATLYFQWDNGKRKLLQMSFGEPENGTSLRQLLPSLCNIGPEFLQGDETLLNRPLSGDFSTQANAAPEEIAAALQKILRAEWNLPIELRLEKSPQEVYVASGIFEMNTEAQKRGFVLVEGALVGISGSVNEAIEHARANILPRGDMDGLLGWLGRSIGIPVINEVEQGPESRVRFTSIIRGMQGGEAGNVKPEAIVDSFAEQTGLSIRLEKRDLRILHLNVME